MNRQLLFKKGTRSVHEFQSLAAKTSKSESPIVLSLKLQPTSPQQATPETTLTNAGRFLTMQSSQSENPELNPKSKTGAIEKKPQYIRVAVCYQRHLISEVIQTNASNCTQRHKKKASSSFPFTALVGKIVKLPISRNITSKGTLAQLLQ